MEIKEVTNKNEWGYKQEFLQSWDYGEFLKSVGRDIRRIQIEEKGIKKLQIQYIFVSLPFKISYVYIPWAYIPEEIFTDILHYFKKQHVSFVRAELLNECVTKKYKQISTPNIQVRNTWILDITKSQKELLENMHAKTRYNIGLAQRKDVAVDHIKNIDLFWKLNMITTQRNQYQSHPKIYCEKLLALPNTYQINAYSNGTPIACVILFKYDKTLYYFIGASSNEYRNSMAPYLLQWEAMQLGQRLNCTTYDFWGMAPPAKEGSGKESCYHGYCWQADHNLTGVARFKAGFSGALKSYPDAQEIILNKRSYYFFKIIRMLRKKRAKAGHPLS
ncbi:MAG TPA: hypothetical protein DCS29_04480 [Candidatus Magasanikbacteria bacterium]|nr:hypothetical protein [Candidatus Magasanikbacteria bacterium]